ncbi:MAG: holo-ACP synthase [Planctomycetota bacterium]|nr:holo-ACP synthase [Planctomycetota bacterium]
MSYSSVGGIIIAGMNELAHGIDMVDCARLQETLQRHGERFLERVFTPAELQYCLGKRRELEHLAGRFAAKEAVLKVLGTGWRNGINWTDVEIRNEPSGKPTVRLAGRCREIADAMQLADVAVSISHISTHAIASAIGNVKS